MTTTELSFDVAAIGNEPLSPCLRADEIYKLQKLIARDLVAQIDMGGKKVVRGKLTVSVSIIQIDKDG